MILLAVTTAIAVAETYFSAWLPVPGAALQLLNFLVSVAISTFLFACLFRFLPDRRIAWRRVWVGAAVTAMLFAVGKLANRRLADGRILGRKDCQLPDSLARSSRLIIGLSSSVNLPERSRRT